MANRYTQHHAVRAAGGRRSGRVRRGFTLIEAALVTVIIGVGVVGMLQLLAAGTVSNNTGTEMTTAMNLARNIRELSLGLEFHDPVKVTNWGPEPGETLATYNDLDDLDGLVLSPPIDARRQVISELSGWTQAITVRSVDPDRLTLQVPNGSTPAVRITVVILRNGNEAHRQSWLAFDGR